MRVVFEAYKKGYESRASSRKLAIIQSYRQYRLHHYPDFLLCEFPTCNPSSITMKCTKATVMAIAAVLPAVKGDFYFTCGLAALAVHS